MKNRYIDLIEQTFYFPQPDFTLEEDNLLFHGIPLMEIIKQYGTPVKLTYLPKISDQIKNARKIFNVAMAKVDYQGDYHYAYCTKSSHFSFVMEEVIRNKAHLETSSAFDLNIIETLQHEKLLDKDRYIICNGYKGPQYINNIIRLIDNGFENTIPIIDNYSELDFYHSEIDKKIKIGIRIASEEEPKFEFYTSRLGIGYKDIIPFYLEKIKTNPKFELSMLHFFINTGINDNSYYWNELLKSINIYVELKQVCPSLNALNIGGGWPIKHSLAFEYDYDYMAEEIIAQIKQTCEANNIPDPDIFTEFGSYTVGESGAVLYSVLDQKRQNDRESWNMIDSSFMTTLPDSWAINKRFIMLAVNNWYEEYERIFLGGLTCDSDDYYNSEKHSNAIYLPKYNNNKPQYLGFFNTGAYQETLGGFGGLQHCLIPTPKYVVVDKDKNGEFTTRLFTKEQSYKSMLKILGY